jgi:flagellin
MRASDLEIDSLSLASRSQALMAADALSNAAETVTLSSAALGAGGRRLDIQNTLNSRFIDTLAAGIGNLVDADLSQEAAELTARKCASISPSSH